MWVEDKVLDELKEISNIKETYVINRIYALIAKVEA